MSEAIPDWAVAPPGRGGPQSIPRPATARLGGPAPWAALPPEGRRPTVADVRRSLADAGPPCLSWREREEGIAASAAVLALLYEESDAHLVLTRRTMDLRHHRGEVSFPGGRRDPGEALVDTALREAHEEIGLDRSTVEIIGELDHLATITSGSAIVPYVGVTAERPDVRPISVAEVDAVIHVPLAELCEPAIYREEIWPGLKDHPIFFFELADDTLWGATAAMLRQLLGLATGTLGRGDIAHW